MDATLPLPKTVYLDQNILIDLKDAVVPSENRVLDSALKGGKVRFVVSPWHCVEAARAQDTAAAIATSNFIDELGPAWLRERIDLQKRELQSYLNRKAADTEAIAPICQTVSEIFTQLSGFRSGFVIARTSDIVVNMRTNTTARQALKSAYDLNAVAFEKNFQGLMASPLTKDRLWQLVLRSTAKHLGFQSFTAQIEQAHPQDFRALTTEFEIVLRDWTKGMAEKGMKMGSQRLGDHFHLSVVLPYVDFVVSKDKGFCALVESVKLALPFPTANVVQSLAELVQQVSA